MALFRQLVVVIAVELDPLARLFLRRILPDERLNIRNGGDLGIGHVDDAVIQQAIHAQMNMRVNKTGQDGFAAGVNHLGVVIPIGGYVRAASNRQNPVAPNGDRLGDLILAVDGQNNTVLNDLVCKKSFHPRFLLVVCDFKPRSSRGSGIKAGPYCFFLPRTPVLWYNPCKTHHAGCRWDCGLA